jgi:hypothetical protein
MHFIRNLLRLANRLVITVAASFRSVVAEDRRTADKYLPDKAVPPSPVYGQPAAAVRLLGPIRPSQQFLISVTPMSYRRIIFRRHMQASSAWQYIQHINQGVLQ